jgi:phosphonate transport system substrate-binding protein
VSAPRSPAPLTLPATLWALLTVLPLAAAAQPTVPEPLRIGVVPYVAIEKLREQLAPIAGHLARALERPVELVFATDYKDALQLVRSGKVPVALLPPVPLAQALRDIPGVALAACQVRQGKPAYRGYLIVRRDSPVRRLEDLRGRSIAFVDRQSTSGYIFPVRLLVSSGLISHERELEGFFEKVEHRGRHDEVLRAVAAGEVDAGAVVDLVLSNSIEADVDPGRVRILARTAPIPHEGVLFGPGLSEQDRRQVREALLALDTRTPQGRNILRPRSGELRINGFTACDATHFAPVLETLEAIH